MFKDVSAKVWAVMWVVALVCIFLLSSLGSNTVANTGTFEDQDETRQVIVKVDANKVESSPLLPSNFKQAYVNQKLNDVINNTESIDQTDVKKLENLPVFVADLNDAEIAELEANDKVADIQENELVAPTLSQSVPLVNADDVHDLGYDGTGVAVAILDTGVDKTHSFVDVISEACYSNAGGSGGGTSLCPGGVTSSTSTGSGVNCTGITNCDHGTHVAGIAAGTGAGESFSGVAKGSGVIAIQVFTSYSGAICTNSVGYSPCLLANTSDIILGLDRVLTLENDSGFTTPISSANLSLGGGIYNNQSTCDSANPSTKSAIDSLRTAGIATVISSGNNGSSSGISSPGCISSAIAVGSTTKADAVSSFSNSGSLMDLWAPGSSITSSVIGDGNFSAFSGTSMAAPHVTGAWALAKQKVPQATVSEVLVAIEETGTDILDARNGLTFPRLDIGAAMDHTNLNGITVTVTDNSTSEAGATATVQFTLRNMPSDNVTIPLSISDDSEATLGGVTEIQIAPANWDDGSANEITITGLDDSDGDGDIPFNLVTGDPTSLDPTYDSIDAADVVDAALVNKDDELIGSDVVFGDTNGDGIDEAHLIRYSETGSGKIEIHTWNSKYTGWIGHAVTTHRETPLGQVSVTFGDTNGDGIDEAHLIKYSNTGSGKIEIHTWSQDYSNWVAHSATTHSSLPYTDVSVQFGNTTGGRADEAHLIKFINTGSGKIEIHTWNSKYTGWIGHAATTHAEKSRNILDVQFGNSSSNGYDEAHLTKFDEVGSGQVEVHTWSADFTAWATHFATNHTKPASRYDVNVAIAKTINGPYDNGQYVKYASTGSGQIEVHTWSQAFNDWLVHAATNHSGL